MDRLLVLTDADPFVSEGVPIELPSAVKLSVPVGVLLSEAVSMPVMFTGSVTYTVDGLIE